MDNLQENTSAARHKDEVPISSKVYLTIHAQIIIGDTITMSSRLEKRSFGNQIAVIP